MRRLTILALGSALTPMAAFFAGCLSSSTTPPLPGDDAGFDFDAAVSPLDSSVADSAVSPPGADSGTPEAGTLDTGSPAETDSGKPDSGAVDAGPHDSGQPTADSGADAGSLDSGEDSGFDAGVDAGPGPVAGVPTSTVLFAVTCGAGASAQQSVTISNAMGSAPLVLSNVTSVNGLVTIVSTPGPIAAGSSGVIMISAKAAVIGTALGGQSYADSLSFQTNETGAPTHTVPISVAVSGANLQFVQGDAGVFNGVIDFTTCSPTFAYGVTNTGNMPTTVTSPMAAGTSTRMLDQTFVNGVAIAPGATASDTAAGFSNNFSAACAGTDTYVFTEAPTDAVCEPLPLAAGQQALQIVYNYDVSSCHNGMCC